MRAEKIPKTERVLRGKIEIEVGLLYRSCKFLMHRKRVPDDEQLNSSDEGAPADDIISKAVVKSMIALIAFAVFSLVFYVARILSQPQRVSAPSRTVSLPPSQSKTFAQPPTLPWKDITAISGITFTHRNGERGDKLLPETMGGGCGFLDYNNDGAIDILFVNSRDWIESGESPHEPTLSLFANDGFGKFRDITTGCGLNCDTYGQGCAIGDYDNDGWVDIYVTGISFKSEVTADLGTVRIGNEKVGPNRLFRNCAGHFKDVTSIAKVSGAFEDWSTGAGWFDYDNDGDLDLWVCNYLKWSKETDLNQGFKLSGGMRAYGRPQAFAGSYPRMFRNDGNSTFVEVSESAGIRIDSSTTNSPMAKSLGLAFNDFNRDGYVDIAIANDTVQNQLFRNIGNGRFEDLGVFGGFAFDSDGNARGAMGIDVSFSRHNYNSACVAIGNFSNEMTAFYVSQPSSFIFSDEAMANGLGPASRKYLTFGVFFIDADLDGRDDLIHVNGHLESDIELVQASQSYKQPPQFFWNAGQESSIEYVALTARELGDDFVKPLVGRGASYADIDNDGDVDILFTSLGSPPRLLRNDQSLGHNWLRVKLVGNGTTSNVEGVGAFVEATTRSRRKILKFVSRTRSYLSQTENVVTFGLGKDFIDELVIRWPGGEVQNVLVSSINSQITIHQRSKPL